MSGLQRVAKPWGFELWWAVTDSYVGKLLHVRMGERLSLQYHKQKDESCYVLSGRVLLTKGMSQTELSTRELGCGAVWRNRPGEIHTIQALQDSDVLEVSTPHLDDVVRLYDDYGRAEERIGTLDAVEAPQTPTLIDKEQLARKASLSRSEVADLLSDPGFPAPCGYFRGRLVWDEATLDRWFETGRSNGHRPPLFEASSLAI